MLEAFLLFGQQPPTNEIQGWIQIVTSGGFAALAWYLIAVALPKMQTRFDEHSDKQQQAFIAESTKQREAHEETIKRIVEQSERTLDRVMQATGSAKE